MSVKLGLATAPLASLALFAAHADERTIVDIHANALAQSRAAAAELEPDPRADDAVATASTRADPVGRWRPYIAEASRRFGVPAVWIEQVMRAESGGHTRLGGRPITSRAGAMGLMQLMPATWSEVRAELALGTDPYDPRDNVLAGTAYLAALYRRFGYPGLFGAYNAGPARYGAWLAGRGPLPAETRLYLARVGGEVSPGMLFADRTSASSSPLPSSPLRTSSASSPAASVASPASSLPSSSSSSSAASSAAKVANRPPRALLFAVDRSRDDSPDSPDSPDRPPREQREGLFVALSGGASSPGDN
jgi:hypothetical protein